MNTTELLSVFNSEMGGIAQQLVSDTEKFRYMDEAYRRFVRLTGGISDATSEAAEVDITVGEAEVELHPSILQILRATRASDGARVEVINYTDLDRLNLKIGEAGAVRYLMIGSQPHTGTWLGTPTRADTVQLLILRLPLKHLTGAGQRLSEIDEEHHLALLDWMKALAYKRPGAEYFNPSLSAAFAASFKDYCAQVKAEIATTKHKVRNVVYGGY